MHSTDMCRLSSLCPCQSKILRPIFKTFLLSLSILPEPIEVEMTSRQVSYVVGSWHSYWNCACMPRVTQMWTGRGWSVNSPSRPPYKYKAPKVINSSTPVALTLATLAPSLTSSLPEKKRLATVTSSTSYSHRPRTSSPRCRRSRLPPPS
jgi:hypothetical protein